jgi:hypothetical protein
MADAKSKKHTFEVVAGTRGRWGHADGPLCSSKFDCPLGLCRWRDSIIVAGGSEFVIRQIDGVVGIPIGCLPRETKGSAPVSAEQLAASIMAAALILPKEMAAIIAEYAYLRIGVRTIAGKKPQAKGCADGHALREAQFGSVTSVAIDESDPVAGPQLIICDRGNHRICGLNTRTEQVTTIAGDAKGGSGNEDGPVSTARMTDPFAVAVAPSTGVIFVTEGVSRRATPPTALIAPYRVH